MSHKTEHFLVRARPKLVRKHSLLQHVYIKPNLHVGARETKAILSAVSMQAELDELDELHWQAQFAASKDKLARMAAKALQDYREGRTIDLDPDKL